MLQNDISYTEYLRALSLVNTYNKKKLSKVNPYDSLFPHGRTIDLSGKISNTMFKVLVFYYRFNYQIEINKTDLTMMYANLLAAIDYTKLQKYRGLGSLGISKLQKIIELNLEQQEI